MSAPGIVRLYSAVITAMDGDDNFDNTVYGGSANQEWGRIHKASATLGDDYRRMKEPEHPNLMRAMVRLVYHRIRHGEGDPKLLELFLSVIDKMKNKSTLKAPFQDRIFPLDDENDPGKDGITTSASAPWCGVKSNFEFPEAAMSHQREERLEFQAWIFVQRFPNKMSATIIGE